MLQLITQSAEVQLTAGNQGTSYMISCSVVILFPQWKLLLNVRRVEMNPMEESVICGYIVQI